MYVESGRKGTAKQGAAIVGAINIVTVNSILTPLVSSPVVLDQAVCLDLMGTHPHWSGLLDVDDPLFFRMALMAGAVWTDSTDNKPAGHLISQARVRQKPRGWAVSGVSAARSTGPK